jgi:anti-sigma B factor antagonist
MSPLVIDVEQQGASTVLVPRGEIDLDTAPALREALVAAIGDGARIIVDLEAVSFIDSVGLGMLVSGLKRARSQGGDLELVCTSQAILKPLEITGLDRVFTIHAARDAAA